MMQITQNSCYTSVNDAKFLPTAYATHTSSFQCSIIYVTRELGRNSRSPNATRRSFYCARAQPNSVIVGRLLRYKGGMEGVRERARARPLACHLFRSHAARPTRKLSNASANFAFKLPITKIARVLITRPLYLCSIQFLYSLQMIYNC